MNVILPPPQPGGKLPDCKGLKKLRDAGCRYEDIMRFYGVTNQSVHRKLRLCGLAEPNVDYGSLIPWRVAAEHRNQNVNILLHLAAREQLGVATPLSERKQRELDLWLQKLAADDLVVSYGPHIAPDGSRRYGFHYVPRRVGVDKWITRNVAVE